MNGVYWIYGGAAAPLAPGPAATATLAPMPLGIVLCPRGGKHLYSELLHLRRSGVHTLVSLLSEEQVEMLELDEEGLQARRLGMIFLHHPVPDHQLPPDVQAFRMFAGDLANRLRAGQRIGIHCWGSIGRATVATACTLIHLGWEPRRALKAVEDARGVPVPDTEEQERWILNYRAHA
jgi:protein-tyrosine phosphatase